MNLIISYDVKFKTNENKIEKIFAHFGLRKIQNSTYIGNLDKNE
ncbi:MAG: CRISPR-associated endonuclease Cas2 [Methanobrevibacter sp.]|nr:CRISPR-associated endonuclease Cas2 [Methanobrevibacter sp.]